jgi:predicted O-methyltransferase YrrM
MRPASSATPRPALEPGPAASRQQSKTATMSFPSKLAFARMVLGTAGRFAGLTSQSIFKRSCRVRLREIGYSLGYVEVQPQLKTASFNEILDHAPKIQLMNVNQDDWHVTVFELAVINAFIAGRKPANIFEIGTFDGRTTLNMYLNAEKQAQITTIDLSLQEQNLPDGKAVGEMIRDLVDRGEITLLYGNSVEYDFSPYYGTQDLVFIDANHTYENVKSDSAVAMRLIRGRTACVLWHDYLRWPGVTRAVDELAAAHADAGRFTHIAGTTLACLICP